MSQVKIILSYIPKYMFCLNLDLKFLDGAYKPQNVLIFARTKLINNLWLHTIKVSFYVFEFSCAHNQSKFLCV